MKKNYKADIPPPSIDDLKFQQYIFDPRLPRNSAEREYTTLSSRFFNSLMGDKSLSWQLGNAIYKAGSILRGK